MMLKTEIIEEKKNLKIPEDYNLSNNRGRREQSLPTQLILSERLMIFIDGESLFQFQKEENVIIDFKKPLVLIDGKLKEKGVDVRIASDIIWHGLSDNYDTFVLISGDKDLMDCLIRMKDNGKKVIIANFEDRISREMKKISDRYINLSQHINEIKLK